MVVAAQLRALLVCLLCYRDDILVLSSSHPQAASDIEMILKVFQQHGFMISRRKSYLTPTTHIIHLSAIIDSVEGLVFLSPDWMLSLTKLVSQVRSQQMASPLLLSQHLGKMVSCIAIIPWARRHAQLLQ